MKRMRGFHRKAELFLVLVLLTLPTLSRAAVMNDYCIVPPFIGKNVPANLLLMIENSSSMWDLAYSDEGNKDAGGNITRQPYYCYDETYKSKACNNNSLQNCTANADCGTGKFCSNNSQTSCTADADCGSGNSCLTKACVANDYSGYFDKGSYYSFNFTDNYFEKITPFPASTSCTKFLANTLCVRIDSATTPDTVDYFVASGNYLNWLTMSKFDVEKQILTGGKDVVKLCYSGGVATNQACNSNSDCPSGQTCTDVTDFLQAESRGCVGQGFIKTALTADFVNFTGTPDPNNVNKLGITFSIRGPFDSANPSAPSRGGQTYIDIYEGTYNNELCQAAIDNWNGSVNQTTLANSVQACLNYNPDGLNRCKVDSSIVCTTDADCIVHIPAQMGGCTVTGAPCTPTTDCGSVTIPGTCSNQAATCMQASDCTVVGTYGTCSNGAGQCTQASDCTIATVYGTCTNQAASCTAPVDCTIAAVNGTCGGGSRAGLACTAGTDCPVAEVLGFCNVNTGVTCRTTGDCAGESYYCSNNPNKSCSTLGAACSGSNGTCVAQSCIGYDPPDNAACNGYQPGSTGSCNGYSPGSTGSCNGYVVGSAGSCVGVNITPNTCTNPPYTPASDPDKGPCVNPDHSGVVKTKIAFSQTIQTCWTYLNGQSIQNGDYTRLAQKCDDVYAAWMFCSHDNSIACTADGDCGAGNTCGGPLSIHPGNPALVCSNSYLGQFCINWNPATKSCSSWSAWDTTTVGSVYAGFCNAQQPMVIDPTDSASSSTNFEQLPALLGGIGVEAQLGEAIGSLPVRVKADTTACTSDSNCSTGHTCVGSVCTPSGLIQEFGDRIRIGAMSFNFNGSSTEASSTAGAAIKLPRVCSNDHTRLCILDEDCPGSSCLDATSSASYNLDGGQIDYGSYIGEGKCATMTATACSASNPCGSGTCIEGFCGTWQSLPVRCATNSNCSSGDTCISNGGGGHTTGLVNTVDWIRANAWTPLAEAFYSAIGYFARTSSGTSRTDLRINSGDFDANLNPSQYKCQQNYILLISDGSSTADQHASVQSLASTYSAAANPYATAPVNWNSTCPNYNGSTYLPILSWIARNRNIADFTAASTQGRDNITTYVVTTGGSNGLPPTDECNSTKLLSDTAKNGGTTLKQANKPQDLAKELKSVFEELAAKSASGTAASILSNSEGSGANILQAIFYPRKIFDSQTEASWLGELNNLWYYVDPFIGNSSMREDTDTDFALNLINDNVVKFWFDNVTGETKVNLSQDTNGDGTGDSAVAGRQGISPDSLKRLWTAGKQLWERDLVASPRTIYTPCITGGTSTTGATCTATGVGLMKFSWSSPDNSAALQTGLQYPADNAAAVKLMKYVHGFDYPGDTTMRSRTVKIGNIPSAELTDAAYTTNPRDKGKGVWKLGDIVSSTPRTQSSVRQNAYNLPKPGGYGDGSYGDDVNKTGYIYTNAYKSRGMVYVGANDGMLHAFRLGSLEVTPSGTQKATLTGTDLGNEEWAFIPRNVLPYLKYYAERDYSHLYFVDGNTALVDASVGTPAGCSTDYYNCAKDSTTWRSILIGGMGIGGASRNVDDTCSEDAAGTCVKTPIDGVGYSSYYALDVTDPADPQLLWEFSDAVITDSAKKGLGFATSGAAVVRIKARDADNNPDGTKNGRWFAVFGSGPTGPIDSTSSSPHRFMGTAQNPTSQATQKLKIYVVDLTTTTTFEEGVNYWVISDVYDGGTNASATISGLTATTITNAFTGTLVNAPIDTDRWNGSSDGFYQDNALYFGYSQKSGSTWTNGGVLRLATNEDPNPANWRMSKVFDGIGPVTTGIARLQDRKNKHLWLYFGPGRYFYFKDDFDAGRNIFGIKEPCYTINNTLDPGCAVKKTFGDVVNQANADQTTINVGWRIPLEGVTYDVNNNKLGGERTITDPVAMTNGAVFFTTYKPNDDFCQYGGNSYMWAVKYDTGTEAPTEALKGRALVQVSTGEFKEIDLSTAFTQNHNRKMATGMTGKPPSDPPPIVSKGANKPVKRILHIQER